MKCQICGSEGLRLVNNVWYCLFCYQLNILKSQSPYVKTTKVQAYDYKDIIWNKKNQKPPL